MSIKSTQVLPGYHALEIKARPVKWQGFYFEMLSIKYWSLRNVHLGEGGLWCYSFFIVAAADGCIAGRSKKNNVSEYSTLS